MVLSMQQIPDTANVTAASLSIVDTLHRSVAATIDFDVGTG